MVDTPSNHLHLNNLYTYQPPHHHPPPTTHHPQIIKPVAICMLVSAALVIFLDGIPLTQQLEQAISERYLVYSSAPTDASGKINGGEAFGQSLVNVIVIISVIAVETTLLVLCMKFKCWKTLSTVLFMVGAQRSVVCAVLCGTVLCSTVLCCAVQYCAVLCCAVLCYVALSV